MKTFVRLREPAEYIGACFPREANPGYSLHS
jgi:hypothetical protein